MFSCNGSLTLCAFCCVGFAAQDDTAGLLFQLAGVRWGKVGGQTCPRTKGWVQMPESFRSTVLQVCLSRCVCAHENGACVGVGFMSVRGLWRALCRCEGRAVCVFNVLSIVVFVPIRGEYGYSLTVLSRVSVHRWRQAQVRASKPTLYTPNPRQSSLFPFLSLFLSSFALTHTSVTAVTVFSLTCVCCVLLCVCVSVCLCVQSRE